MFLSSQKSQVEGLEAQDLQEVWLLVNKEVLKHILRVLPERHPSYRYTFSLQDLFLKVQQVLPSPDEVGYSGQTPSAPCYLFISCHTLIFTKSNV